jgi:bilin biosynthesis protein
MSEWDRIVADLHNVLDVDRAVKACEALDKAADESWLPRLHRLLANDKSFFVREAAAFPIARLEGLRALPNLLHALKRGEEDGHDNDGLVSVISDLVSADQGEAAPLLLQMIRSRSERKRSDAAWLWGFAAEALTPEPLLKLVNDSSHRVRRAAIGSLASFKGREDVFGSLVNALEDPDEEVRCSAASSLGYFGDKRAISPLRRLYYDAPESVRRIVEYAIKQLGNAG